MEVDDLIVKHSGNGIKDTYTLKQVRHLVFGMKSLIKQESPEPTIKFNRSNIVKIKKGDLFTGMSINHKARPYVVAIVRDDMAYCIPLTTTEDEHSLLPHKSRFLKAGFYCNSFTVVKTSFVLENFKGVMDDNRNLNKAIKLITKQTLTDLL